MRVFGFASIQLLALRILVALALGGMPGFTVAAEPASAFLEALKREGLHDLAIAYLDRVERSGRAPKEFLERIPIERAELVAEAAKKELDFVKRRALLAQAATGLESAEKLASDPRLLVDLRRALLDTLLRQARLLMTQAQLLANGGGPSPVTKEAMTTLESASRTAQSLEEQLRELLQEMQQRPPAEQDVAVRDRWRGLYIQARITRPTVLLESTELLAADPPEARKRLKEAADLFAALAEQYSTTRFAEVYLTAQLKQGECLRRLGKFSEALDLFQEILETEGVPPVFLATATQGVMECWSHPDVEKLEDAIKLGESWLKQNPRAEESITAPVRLALAQTYASQGQSAQGTARNRAFARAQRLLVELAQDPVPQAALARRLLANLPRDEATAPQTTQASSFADAKLEAETALGKLQANLRALDVLRAQLAAANDPTEREPIETQVAEAEENLRTERANVVQRFRLALDQATPSDPVESIHDIHFLMAYLLFENDDYWDAIVYSEHLARSFSDARPARGSARIALGAYFRLLERGLADKDFLTRKVKSLAEFIANRWPNDEEGQQALLTLVRFLVSENRVDDAVQYVRRLPKDSPLRGEAFLATGSALYRESRAAVAARAEDAPANPIEPNDALRRGAREMLDQGLAADSLKPENPVYVLAVLSRARLHLEDREFSQALKLLTEPAKGPYALIQKKSDALTDAGLVDETYRVTLQAYLTMLADPKAREEANREIESILTNLSERLGGQEKDRQRLVAIYVGLAQELRSSLESIAEAEREAVALGFLPLLKRIAETSADPQVLLWVAHTAEALAEPMPQPTQGINLKAQPFHEVTNSALQRALQIATESQSQESLPQIRMGIASLKRRMRDFPGAIEQFASILKETPTLWNVQFQAAYTYQEGGAYRFAIKGGRPDPATKKNIIWGWERISMIANQQMRLGAEQREKYSDSFHEARYQIAWCRFQEALKLQGEKRTRYLRQARQAITSIAALYPDLGGPQWKPKYIRLQKEIEQQLGE